MPLSPRPAPRAPTPRARHSDLSSSPPIALCPGPMYTHAPVMRHPQRVAWASACSGAALWLYQRWYLALPFPLFTPTSPPSVLSFGESKPPVPTHLGHPLPPPPPPPPLSLCIISSESSFHRPAGGWPRLSLSTLSKHPSPTPASPQPHLSLVSASPSTPRLYTNLRIIQVNHFAPFGRTDRG